VAVNTLRARVRNIGPRRSAAEYPISATRYSLGTVRWDLPLIRGRRTQVLVQCDCGRERHVAAHQIDRPGRGFNGACDACTRASRKRERSDRIALPCPVRH
jgi:hypothetical protein